MIIDATKTEVVNTTILQQVTDAVKSGKHSVKIKPGVYKVKPEQPSQPHLTLYGLHDIEIDARGVTLLCTNPSTALDILNCRKVTLRGLKIDYNPLPFTQGTIVGFASDRTWTDVKIHRGYAAPHEYDSSKTNEKQAFLWTYDRVTRLMKAGAINRFVERIIGMGNDVYRLDHGTTQFRDQAAIGDYIRIPQPFERPSGINVIGCEGLTLLEVTLHSAPTHFGVASRFCSDLTFRKVRVIPGPLPAGATEKRLCSTVGDGLNFSGITGKLVIENCELQCTGDDGIAIYSEDGIVLGQPSADKITASFSTPGSPALKPGTKLRFMIGKLGTPHEAVVVTSVPTTMPRAAIDTVRKRACKEPYGDCLLGSAFDIQLDKPITANEGDLVLQTGEGSLQFVIRGNRVTNAGSRGIVVNQSYGIVENNTVNRTYLPGIHIFTDFRSHGYSSSQRNVIIRNNSLSETCSIWPTQDGWLGAICVSNWEGDAYGYGNHYDGDHRDIRIDNNTITNAWGVNIQVHRTIGVSILRNRFIKSHMLRTPNGSPRVVDNGSLIYLQDANDVTISYNSVVLPGPNMNKEPLTCVNVTDVKAVRPFKY